MKIALLASSFLPRIGGAEVVVHNLAQQWQALGHDVAVITWWGLWKDIRGHVPYPVYPLLPRSFTTRSRQAWQQGRGKRWPVAVQIAAYQLRYRFDTWNIHLAFPAGIMATPMLRSMNVPVITTCHGGDIATIPSIGNDLRTHIPLNEAIEDSLRRSTFVTALGTFMHDEIRQAGVEEEQVADIPNGVDVHFLQNKSRNSEEVRCELGLSADRKILLSVGRNHKVKGYDRIPTVVRHLARYRQDFVWVLVGDQTETIEERARHEGLGEFVRGFNKLGMDGDDGDEYRLPPRRLVELYQLADLYVLTSTWESFGMVMIEAMAAGTPVVAFETPGSCDLLRDGRGGVLCEAGNEEAMAREIEDLLNSSERRTALSEGAVQKAASYDWSTVAKQYISVFERATAER